MKSFIPWNKNRHVYSLLICMFVTLKNLTYLAVPMMFVMSLLLTGCGDATSGTRISPEIMVPGGIFRDHGVVDPDSRITETFQIVNTSHNIIRLKKHVDTSCGCTAAELSTTEIPPGNHSDLKMIVHVPEADLSKQRVTAVVHVDDSENVQSFVVGIGYSVALPWNTIPKTLRLSGSPGMVEEGTVMVRRAPGAKISIRQVEAKGLSLDVKWGDFVADEANIQVICRLPETRGRYCGDLLVTTSDEKVSSQTVVVECLVHSQIQSMPESLLFTVSSSTSQAKQFLKVFSDHNFRIDKVQCRKEGISLKYLGEDVTSVHTLEVEVDPNAFTQGLSRFTFIAHLSDEQRKKLETLVVPVLVVKESSTANHRTAVKGRVMQVDEE